MQQVIAPDSELGIGTFPLDPPYTFRDEPQSTL